MLNAFLMFFVCVYLFFFLYKKKIEQMIFDESMNLIIMNLDDIVKMHGFFFIDSFFVFQVNCSVQTGSDIKCF